MVMVGRQSKCHHAFESTPAERRAGFLRCELTGNVFKCAGTDCEWVFPGYTRVAMGMTIAVWIALVVNQSNRTTIARVTTVIVNGGVRTINVC